ncbi:rhodanese-like domain-containing protein [uncultured Sphaerochaeta sp.]|uniref:rhodanese-like domain-containing protein n=1 Tax=uncultured Sphaerochaeta sp. TaxID=886478 RepID=UPI002A0A1B1C|nr:rhodanese-like domain-containing protein [uncultured Sphaerochaeta sp.]
MNKLVVIGIILLVVVVIVVFFFVNHQKPANKDTSVQNIASSGAMYHKISPEEAKKMMDSGKTLTILDVRTPSEFSEGHIKNAINIANETIGSTKPTLLPDLDATILVYCRSGNRSNQSARKLVAMGYTNIYDFGGLNTWSYETVR